MLSVPKIGASAPALAAVGGAPAAAPATDPNVVLLTKPIRSHAGDVRELRLREPMASDYIEIGRVPFEVRGSTDADRRAMVDFKVAGQWAVRLTSLDDILVGQLCATDWLELVGRINALLMKAGIGDVGN